MGGLDGVAFEVDAAPVGDHVTLRYDPAKAPAKRTAEVKRIEIARRVDVLANCFIERNDIRRQLQVPKPDDVAEVLAMRELVDRPAELDDEELF